MFDSTFILLWLVIIINFILVIGSLLHAYLVYRSETPEIIALNFIKKNPKRVEEIKDILLRNLEPTMPYEDETTNKEILEIIWNKHMTEAEKVLAGV